MLDANKLLAYLDEMIEKTDVDDEYKRENLRKAGANDAFRAVKALVQKAMEEPAD